MSKPDAAVYKVGDLVQISNSSAQHAGDLVLITRAVKLNDTWVYDWVIPEQRGSVPQQMIDRKVIGGVNLHRLGLK